MPNWLLGMLLITVSSFIAATGLLFFKASADREAGKPLYCRLRWMIGFASVLICGLALDPTAIALTPVALLSPFSGVVIVFSLILSRAFMGVRLGVFTCGCIVVMIAGVVIVGVFGPHPESEPTIHDIRLLAARGEAIALCTVALCFVASNLSLVHIPALRRYRPHQKSLRWSLYVAVSAASCGALTTVSLKIVSIGFRTLAEDAAVDAGVLLSTGVFPVALVALACCAPLQLYLLNASLGAAPVTYAVPVYQSLNSLSGAFVGAIVFDEFRGVGAHSVSLFAVGMLIAVVGIALLSMHQGRQQQRQRQEEQRQEEQRQQPNKKPEGVQKDTDAVYA